MSAIAGAGLWKEKILKAKDELGKRETFPLDPDEFILAQTYERIWVPRNLIAMVEGRRSYARAGLSMHQTAPWIQPGWNGQITLEIRNSGPLQIELDSYRGHALPTHLFSINKRTYRGLGIWCTSH